MKRLDITGHKYGYWEVIGYTGGKYWRCRCCCGVEREVRGSALRAGYTKSCGCSSIQVYQETSKSRNSRYSKLTPEQKEKHKKEYMTWKRKQGRTWAANRSCLNNHGCSLEDKYALLRKQGFRCANPACDFTTLTPSVTLSEWCFDHDHNCKDGSCAKCQRGLLCNPCNKALGQVKDVPEILEGLASYLRSWKER